MPDGSPPAFSKPPSKPDFGNNRGRRIDVEIGRLVNPGSRTRTPKTRAECPTVRPCPHVACRHNLYLDVTEAGTLKVPEHEPWDQDAASSCVFDLRGGMSLAEVSRVLKISGERARQIEAVALAKLREAGVELEGLSPEYTPGPAMPYMKGDF